MPKSLFMVPGSSRIPDLVRTVARIAVVLGLLAGASWVVYAAGGTKTVWPHLLYFGVVAAAAWFGVAAGTLSGIMAGLMVGPWMPLDVAAAEPQPLRGWLVRMGFFVGIGVLVGYHRTRLVHLIKARQVFLSGVSHELRTPLAVVLGFTQLVHDRYDEFADEERREYIGLAYREAEELAATVDGFVIAGRLDDAALVIEPTTVDLYEQVRLVLQGIPAEIRSTRMRLVGESAACWADPLRVRQVVRNLIGTGLAYGGERVEIEVATVGSDVVLVIADPSGGLPTAAIRLALRQPVWGAHEPRPSNALVMAFQVARRLTELMGGDLTYREEDSASSFVLRLPVSPPRMARRGASAQAAG